MADDARIKQLESEIAALSQRGMEINPSAVAQVLAKKQELANLKATPEEKEAQKAAAKNAIDFSKTIIDPAGTMLDIQTKTGLDLKKNVKNAAQYIAPPPPGAATEAETLAANPYNRIGSGGFFAGPEPRPVEQGVKAVARPVEQGVKAVAKAVGPAAAKAVAEEAQKGVLYPPPQTPTPPPGEPDGAQKGEGIDFGAIAKKLGVGVLELVNAFAMGQAGITDPSKLAAGQRIAREQEAAQLKASQDQAKAELDFQTKKDQLDREFNAEQQAIQNKFTQDRDAAAAKVAADEAAKKYQYDLGLIRAELDAAQQKATAADMPDWVKSAMAGLAGKQGQAAAAGSNEPWTISSEEAHALEAKRKAEAAKRGKN